MPSGLVPSVSDNEVLCRGQPDLVPGVRDSRPRPPRVKMTLSSSFSEQRRGVVGGGGRYSRLHFRGQEGWWERGDSIVVFNLEMEGLGREGEDDTVGIMLFWGKGGGRGMNGRMTLASFGR